MTTSAFGQPLSRSGGPSGAWLACFYKDRERLWPKNFSFEMLMERCKRFMSSQVERMRHARRKHS